MALEYPTVNDIVQDVAQDVRQQVTTVQPPQQTMLIDFTNRIHKQMLRFSRWEFLRSDPVFFITTYGQTDYWLGPDAACPNGTVNTNLNLIDVDRIEKDSVRDFSNNNQLKSLGSQPIGWALNQRSGQTRPDHPRTFWQDRNQVNLLHIYPAPDNQNPYSPVPQPPLANTVAGGALALRTYFLRLTFVDSLGGESAGSSVSVSATIPASQLVSVGTPTLYFTQNASGVQYNGYNVYASTQEGTETKQNTTPIEIGTNWTEPTTGLTTTGTIVPTNNTLASMEGYLIQFRYYKDRLDLENLDDTLQIPTDYFDVVVQGVLSYVWRILGRADEAKAAWEMYQAGLKEMIWDKNLFPDSDFIRPDSGSYVNQQILGVLPEDF
jgi:hypothetical protein